jgi:hypothetical protein
MIPIEIAAGLIELLANLDDYPHNNPALQYELAKALSHSDSEEDAREFIDSWKRYNTRCPREAEIHFWIDSRRRQREENDQSPLAPYRCEQCQDTGWVYATSRGVKECPGCRTPSAETQKAGKR